MAKLAAGTADQIGRRQIRLDMIERSENVTLSDDKPTSVGLPAREELPFLAIGDSAFGGALMAKGKARNY